MLALREEPADDNLLFVLDLPCAVRLRKLANRVFELLELVFVVVQRVAREVEAGRFAFFDEDDLVRKLRRVRQRNLRALQRVSAVEVEKRHLTRTARLFERGGGIQRALVDREVLRAFAAHAVEAARADQRLQHALVEAVHAVAEVEKVREGSVLRAFLHHGFHDRAADVSHRGEAEADRAVFRSKPRAGEVYIRRKHLDAVVARAVHVARDRVHRT